VSRRFTLLDDPYYDALLRVCELLETRGLEFCLVGGGAAQAWIATMRTGAGERRLADEPLLKTALRRTRDLDFATRADPADMVRALNDLAASTGADAHVLGPRLVRLGAVSISLTLGPDDLSGMGGLYDTFLGSRVPLHLRRAGSADAFPTIGLEALLVTKLTRRGDKAKDMLDVAQLLAAAREAGRVIDYDAIRRLAAGHPEAMALLEEVRRDVEPS
jgi:hypothetical protein